MKTLKVVLITGVFIFLQSCCWLFKEDCEPCEEIQQGAELADLLLTNFESEQDETEEDTIVYDIVHTVLNFANDLECPEEVSAANSHTDKLQLIYSESSDFSNSELIDTQNALVEESVSANANYKVNSEISFVQDGFYSIENTIDNTNLVPERNENNNNDQNTPGSRIKYRPNPLTVIHITKAMTSKLKEGDKNNIGKQKYISSWKVRVEY